MKRDRLLVQRAKAANLTAKAARPNGLAAEPADDLVAEPAEVDDAMGELEVVDDLVTEVDDAMGEPEVVDDLVAEPADDVMAVDALVAGDLTVPKAAGDLVADDPAEVKADDLVELAAADDLVELAGLAVEPSRYCKGGGEWTNSIRTRPTNWE